MAKIVISDLQPLNSQSLSNNLTELSEEELDAVFGGLSLGTIATVLSAIGGVLSLFALFV